MGKRDSAKTRIADCFIQLVVESSDPRERVNVTDIVRHLGMDRKSFYRHFDNTGDLVIWIFRSELAEMLSDEQFDGFELLCPDPSLNDQYPSLPFFASAFDGDADLDQGKYTKTLCALFNGKLEYYQRILSFPCYLDFYYYLLSLFEPAVHHSILKILGSDRTMRTSEINFLAEYHTVAYIGRLPYHFAMNRRALPEDELDAVWTYTHDTLCSAVEKLSTPAHAM